MNFAACLSECVPTPDQISPPLVACECVLCYYYYAQQQALPACVVQAAREKCPKIYIDNSDNGGNVRECFMVALIFTSYVL